MYILYIIQDVLCMSACSCMSVYTSACQFLCVCMDACACIYAHKQACMCMIVHVYQKHPGGPETVLVKKKSLSKISHFRTAKQTFLQAELFQILAREFGKICVS